MTDRDTVARVAHLLRTGFRSYRRKGLPAHYKTVYKTAVKGRRAVNIMRRVYPYMCARRQGQIENAIGAWAANVYGHDSL